MSDRVQQHADISSRAVLALALTLAALVVAIPYGRCSEPPRRGSGRLQPGELRWGLYDDFDGHGAEQTTDGGQLAVPGALSPDLWCGDGDVVWAGAVVSNPGGRGRVLRLTSDSTGDPAELWLENPAFPAINMIHSLRGVFYVPAGSTSIEFNAGLHLSASVRDAADPYWHMSINVGPRSWQNPGEVWIEACWEPVGVEGGDCMGMAGGLDTWYALRMDLVPTASGRLQAEFLVNDSVIASQAIVGSELLLEPGRIDWGPERQISLWRSDTGTATALVDTVEASFAVKKPGIAPVYDDFDGHGAQQPDGHELAQAGRLAQALWAYHGEPEVVPNPAGPGDVVRLWAAADGDEGQLHLRDPGLMAIDQLESLSARFRLLGTPSGEVTAGLRLWAELPAAADPWWNVYLNFIASPDGRILLVGCVDDVDSSDGTCRSRQAWAETWYELRIDTAVAPAGQVRIDLLVNGIPLLSRTPPGSEALLSPDRGGIPIHRLIRLSKGDPADATAVLVDDVHARYADLVPAGEGLYDDFDGHGAFRNADETHLAVAGSLSPLLWSGTGSVEAAEIHMPDPGAHGEVLVLRASPTAAEGVVLLNPEVVTLREEHSLIADVLVPSSATSRACNTSLKVAAGLLNQPENYWHTSLSIGADDSSELWLGGCVGTAGSAEYLCASFPALYDTWYTLRIDLARDAQGLRADLLVDDVPLLEGRPDPAGLLDDPAMVEWGPIREISAWADADGEATVLVDAVYADFRRITLNSVEPAEFPLTEPVTVTLRGQGFDPEAAPLSLPWGLDFTAVTWVDSATITATAVARAEALPGVFDVVVANSAADASNPRQVIVSPGTAPPDAAGRFGLYDDFDGRGAEFEGDPPLAVAGRLSPDLWAGSGEVVLAGTVTSNAAGHGHVLLLTPPDASASGEVILTNALHAPLDQFGSLSVKVMLPTGGQPTGAGIEIQGTFCELDNEYFGARAVLRFDGDRAWLDGCLSLPGSTDTECRSRPAQLETWHDLRIDLAPAADESLEVTIFADDRPLLRRTATDGRMLTDLRRTCWGPRRVLYIWPAPGGDQPSAAFDDIRTTFGPRHAHAAPLYDDFDGHGGEQPSGQQLAVAGQATPLLWQLGRGSVVPTPDFLPGAVEHGYAIRFVDAGQGCLCPSNPIRLPWAQWGSLSFELLASSEAPPGEGAFNLELHTGFPETPPGKSFYFQYGMRYRDDHLFAYLYYKNINTTSSHWLDLGPLELDTWYTFRLDFVPIGHDVLRMDAFVDGILRRSEFVSDGGLMLHPSNLLDPGQNGAAFPRFFSGDGDTVYYLDNVRATYTGAPPGPAGGAP